MSKIITLNGIHSDGKTGSDLLGNDLFAKGFETRDYNYPKRWAVSAYFKSVRQDDARGLINIADDGDSVAAHSYGCLVVLEAMLLGAKFDKVFFFGAAASSDKAPWFPAKQEAFNELHVIFNLSDRALILGSKLPFHPFGKLGFKGYRGARDKRIINVDARCGEGKFSLHHNSHLDNKHRHKWVDYISEAMKA